MEFEVKDKKTGRYADVERIARREKWAKDLMYCDMEGFAITQDGSLILLDECGRYEFCPSDRFEVMNLMRGKEYMELISREAVAQVFKSNTIPRSMTKVIKEIAQLPIIESRPKGKWVSVDWANEYFDCSVCGNRRRGTPRYCEDCGAEMEKQT